MVAEKSLGKSYVFGVLRPLLIMSTTIALFVLVSLFSPFVLYSRLETPRLYSIQHMGILIHGMRHYYSAD